MSELPRLLVVTGLIFSGMPLLSAHLSVRGTTLGPARRWAFAAWLLWVLAWTAGPVTGLLAPAAADQLWYAAAIVSLVPPVAVLGAKRPGSRVWTWFVLVPLVLVFAWPALTVWQGLWPGLLQLEPPMIVAYFVVLVMGWGNFVGTAYTLPAILAAAASAVLIWSFQNSPMFSTWEHDATVRAWAAGLLTAASFSALGIAATRPPRHGLDRVWRDFGDRFGIVWAKRLMDRVIEAAEKVRWPTRLDLHGFEWNSPLDPSEQAHTAARAEQTLRGLLRRFVDPEWIDERMGHSSNP
jgi:hypothetical protein